MDLSSLMDQFTQWHPRINMLTEIPGKGPRTAVTDEWNLVEAYKKDAACSSHGGDAPCQCASVTKSSPKMPRVMKWKKAGEEFHEKIHEGMSFNAKPAIKVKNTYEALKEPSMEEAPSEPFPVMPEVGVPPPPISTAVARLRRKESAKVRDTTRPVSPTTTTTTTESIVYAGISLISGWEPIPAIPAILKSYDPYIYIYTNDPPTLNNSSDVEATQPVTTTYEPAVHTTTTTDICQRPTHDATNDTPSGDCNATTTGDERSGVSWEPPLKSCLAKPLQEGSETAATGSHSQDVKSQHRPGVEFLQILGEIKAQQQELNVVKKAEPQFDGKWERIKVTVDSGANAPVMPPHFGQLYPVQESPGSRNGDSYMAANGGIIPNLGQKMLPVVTKEGAVRGYLSQCADVTTGLQSVMHLNRCGHGVWFDGDDSFAVNKETGEMTQIDHDGKDFTMDMWVIPPEELHTLMVNEGFQRHHP